MKKNKSVCPACGRRHIYQGRAELCKSIWFKRQMQKWNRVGKIRRWFMIWRFDRFDRQMNIYIETLKPKPECIIPDADGGL